MGPEFGKFEVKGGGVKRNRREAIGAQAETLDRMTYQTLNEPGPQFADLLIELGRVLGLVSRWRIAGTW